MVGRKRVLILGGSGVFGTLLARELLRHEGCEVVLAGRRQARLDKARRVLGSDRITSAVVDVNVRATLEPVLGDCDAVVCTAGPFQRLSTRIVGACLQAGVHWIDISDDPGWIARVIEDAELTRAADQNHLFLAPGLSTTPAISTALLGLCSAQLEQPDNVTVSLFVGNRNRKGQAVIDSALRSIGAANAVNLLRFGRRVGFVLPSADAVTFHACPIHFFFVPESRIAGRILRTLSRSQGDPTRRARTLRLLSSLTSWFGTDRGSIQVSVQEGDRSVRAAMTGGQRMAILPAAIALRLLLGTDGVARVQEKLGDPGGFLGLLHAEGLELDIEPARP